MQALKEGVNKAFALDKDKGCCQMSRKATLPVPGAMTEPELPTFSPPFEQAELINTMQIAVRQSEE